MKKLVIIISLLLTLSLSGCYKRESNSIIVPTGAPALAQIYLQTGEAFHVDIINGPDALVAAFGSESHDFIFAPTNLGARLYNSDIDYILIAAITFGNLFLATVTEEDFTLEYLNGKDIICFGMNATSDIILRYILEENNINVTIAYVDSVDMANASLIADNSKIILSAEPALSVLKSRVDGIKTIDIQAEYQNLTGEESYPQSGVFAKKTLEKDRIDFFLNELSDSIRKVNEEINETASLAVTFNYGFSLEVLTQAIPNSNIRFKTALDVKNDLETYFNIILEVNPNLIGNKLPDDEFYYVP